MPTKPPERTEGRRARTAPPTTTRCDFGDEDAGLREVDELAEQIRGIERAGATIHTKVPVAQGDETIDIRDTGRSDQVFHAEGSNLAGRRPSLDRGLRPWAGTGARAPFRSASDMTFATRARRAVWGAADRYCIRVADGYDTASFRRSPARRPSRTCVAVRHAPPLVPADVLGGYRRSRTSTRADGRPAHLRARVGVGSADRGRSGTAGRPGHQEENG